MVQDTASKVAAVFYFYYSIPLKPLYNVPPFWYGCLDHCATMKGAMGTKRGTRDNLAWGDTERNMKRSTFLLPSPSQLLLLFLFLFPSGLRSSFSFLFPRLQLTLVALTCLVPLSCV
jgi:hypothetical protein